MPTPISRLLLRPLRALLLRPPGFPATPILPSRIEIPFKFHMLHSGLVHGLAFWFDVAFIGSM